MNLTFDSKKKKEVCYKCRWLVIVPDGFYNRKTAHGPCDRCLGKMTIFQQLWEANIWIRQIPKKDKPKPNLENNSAPKSQTPSSPSHVV